MRSELRRESSERRGRFWQANLGRARAIRRVLFWIPQTVGVGQGLAGLIVAAGLGATDSGKFFPGHFIHANIKF